MPGMIHDKSQFANNRAELSNQPTSARIRGMRRFKSRSQAQLSDVQPPCTNFLILDDALFQPNITSAQGMVRLDFG